jgi:nucleoside-diphosphate-sugar epimerase
MSSGLGVHDSGPVLVTGARGFLGSHIVACGCTLGCDVVAAYRGGSGPGAIDVDVCDPKSVDSAFRAVLPSVVIHCAAYGINYAHQDPSHALEVNVHGALRVLAAAARFGARRFVHIGSCFEYGSHEGAIAECAALNPTAIYGATKAAATLLLRERASALGVSLTVARLFGMWGPGEASHRLVPQVVSACMTRSPLDLTACELVRDYMYVEDMAERILRLASLPITPSETIVNMGSGRSTRLRDFVLSIARCFEGEGLMRFGALAYRPTEMHSLVADVKKMRELLGEGLETPLEVGVARMVAHARAHGGASGLKSMSR